MSVEGIAVVFSSQGWPQGDIRDPLGTWGARVAITGNASGGELRCLCQVAAGQSPAFVYTLYHCNYQQSLGTPSGQAVKLALLTNWPNIDPAAGVQGFASNQFSNQIGDAQFSNEISGPTEHLVGPNDRFILLYDPRSRTTTMDIARAATVNVGVGTNAIFEFYGYYWDRSVLQAPGGPRHPGGS